MMLRLALKPHSERGGYHTDRFDAYLGDQLICTSRSGWHEPARTLLALGYPPDTLLHVQHAGKPHDSTIKPQPIGELAKWTIEDSNRGGLRRRTWAPFDAPRSVGVASPAGDEAEAAV